MVITQDGCSPVKLVPHSGRSATPYTCSSDVCVLFLEHLPPLTTDEIQLCIALYCILRTTFLSQDCHHRHLGTEPQ
jgi:hypothetical protein